MNNETKEKEKKELIEMEPKPITGKEEERIEMNPKPLSGKKEEERME